MGMNAGSASPYKVNPNPAGLQPRSPLATGFAPNAVPPNGQPNPMAPNMAMPPAGMGGFPIGRGMMRGNSPGWDINQARPNLPPRPFYGRGGF